MALGAIEVVAFLSLLLCQQLRRPLQVRVLALLILLLLHFLELKDNLGKVSQELLAALLLEVEQSGCLLLYLVYILDVLVQLSLEPDQVVHDIDMFSFSIDHLLTPVFLLLFEVLVNLDESLALLLAVVLYHFFAFVLDLVQLTVSLEQLLLGVHVDHFPLKLMLESF